MQSAELAQSLDSRPQIEVISVAQQNLRAKFFEDVLRNPFNRRYRADGHEDGSCNFSVRRDQAARASGASVGFNFEFDRHCWDCSGVMSSETQNAKPCHSDRL